MEKGVRSIIEQLPDGYSEGIFKGSKYGITKQVFNNNKSFKVLARELKGTSSVATNILDSDSTVIEPDDMTSHIILRH